MASDASRAALTRERCSPRGPVSSAVLDYLTRHPAAAETDLVVLAADAISATADIVRDDDLQLALFLLYASSYGSLDGLDDTLEWDTQAIVTRRCIEDAFERAVRALVAVADLPTPRPSEVARALFALTAADGEPTTARFIGRTASDAQAHEFLIQRSIYTLREADPHSWAIPRLSGRPKAALVEIQSDEYGGGRPARMHAAMFAQTLQGAGLDSTYGAYVNAVPAVTLASHNLMSLFGLNRRLVGAIVGHLAAFEMTSSIPNRFYGDGFRRLGYGEEVTAYFDEHVEADAVHEQIAAHDLAGGLAADHPELLPDIMFGAAACLAIDGEMGSQMLAAWQEGRSSLRSEVTHG